jgi:Major tropism determinant N-terminal domain
MVTAYTPVQLRRGTTSAWTLKNPVLAEGEQGLEMDTQKFKIGDGVTRWASLPYWTAGALSGSSYSQTYAAALTWTVSHNLGFKPAVTVLSVGGVVVWADVLHISANQALVTFDQPTAGQAVCS